MQELAMFFLQPWQDHMEDDCSPLPTSPMDFIRRCNDALCPLALLSDTELSCLSTQEQYWAATSHFLLIWRRIFSEPENLKQTQQLKVSSVSFFLTNQQVFWPKPQLSWPSNCVTRPRSRVPQTDAKMLNLEGNTRDLTEKLKKKTEVLQSESHGIRSWLWTRQAGYVLRTPG